MEESKLQYFGQIDTLGKTGIINWLLFLHKLPCYDALKDAKWRRAIPGYLSCLDQFDRNQYLPASRSTGSPLPARLPHRLAAAAGGAALYCALCTVHCKVHIALCTVHCMYSAAVHCRVHAVDCSEVSGVALSRGSVLPPPPHRPDVTHE